MALAATVSDVWHDKQRLHIIGTIAASGSYVAGGDTLDFAVRGVQARVPPKYVEIHGQAGFIYRFLPGTGISNGKVQVRCNTAGGANAPLDEHTAAAYAAGVTGDVIRFQAIFDFGT